MALLLRSAEIQPLFARFVPIGLCSGHPPQLDLSPHNSKFVLAAITRGAVKLVAVGLRRVRGAAGGVRGASSGGLGSVGLFFQSLLLVLEGQMSAGMSSTLRECWSATGHIYSRGMYVMEVRRYLYYLLTPITRGAVLCVFFSGGRSKNINFSYCIKKYSAVISSRI